MRRSFSQIAAALVVVLLAACGGGGGSSYSGGGSSGGGGGGGGSGGGGGGGGGTVPPPVNPLSVSEAGRLLEQASFGATDATLQSAQTGDADAWITGQLNQPQFTPTLLSSVDARAAQLKPIQPILSVNQFYEAFWQRAVTANDQLRQRMAFALSQIFVISLDDPTVGSNIRGATSYYDVMEANAFGSYRTLLEAVTLHPMMGAYLTYLGNQKEDAAGTRTPDENYAREVMQLMSIGLVMLNLDGTPKLDASGKPIPAYTQDDIGGLAKVFTGISWYSPAPTNTTFTGGNRNVDSEIRPMIFYPAFHSTSQKQFLGVTIPASASADVAGDLKIALDTIANHPNVGPFMAFHLIQQFVTSNPSPAYVQRVATVFNNNGSGVRGDLAAVIRAVLLDPEARDMTAVSSQTFGKVREPLIRLANWMRAFNANTASGNWLVTSTSDETSFSQSALTAPSVFNFWPPFYVPPNTQMGAHNLYVPEFQAVDEISVASYLNTMQTTINAGIGKSNDVASTYASELAIASDANALADRMNKLLLYGQMSATLRQRVIDGINGVTIPASGQAQIDAASLNRAKLAVFLVMSSPEYLIQR